jgi:hypothetical protein
LSESGYPGFEDFLDVIKRGIIVCGECGFFCVHHRYFWSESGCPGFKYFLDVIKRYKLYTDIDIILC